MAGKHKSDVPVKATQTSFRIIEELMAFNGAGVSELASRLDMPISTVHDHLRTLESEHYVVKEDDQYQIAVRFLELGGHARSRQKLYQTAVPEIKKLAERTGEHANLMIEEHGLGVFLYREKGKDALSLDTYSGMRVPLHTTALGKSILAHLPKERVDAIFDQHGLPKVTLRTRTDRTELHAEFEEIRERGYAFDNEERIDGVRCVAAPVFNNEGTVLGAISVSTPSTRLQNERFREELPRQVLSTANVVEVNLNYS